MKHGKIQRQLTKLDDILGLETPSMHDGNETIVEYVNNLNATKPISSVASSTFVSKQQTQFSNFEKTTSNNLHSDTVPEMSEIDFQYGQADINKLLLASYDAITKLDIPKY